MNLSILGSNSSGNCYILQNDTEALIIEAGIRLSEVKKALDYNLTKVVGCIATHAHGDHSGHIKDIANAGINVFAIADVIKNRELNSHHRAKIINPGSGYLIGNFKVLAFMVSHDIPCVGFHISHPDTGNILFLTDTFTCEYSFPNLNHLLIEANYADDILFSNINSGKVSRGMKRRLMYSHMELQTTKTYLSALDLSQVNTITLIHLSSQNSDEKRFVEEIQGLTGKMVYAADKGMEIELKQEAPY